MHVSVQHAPNVRRENHMFSQCCAAHRDPTAKRDPATKRAPNELFYTKESSSKSWVRISRNLSVQHATDMSEQANNVFVRRCTAHRDPTAKRSPGTKSAPNEPFYIKEYSSKSKARISRFLSGQHATDVSEQANNIFVRRCAAHHDPTAKRDLAAKSAPNEPFYIKELNSKSHAWICKPDHFRRESHVLSRCILNTSNCQKLNPTPCAGHQASRLLMRRRRSTERGKAFRRESRRLSRCTFKT